VEGKEANPQERNGQRRAQCDKQRLVRFHIDVKGYASCTASARDIDSRRKAPGRGCVESGAEAEAPGPAVQVLWGLRGSTRVRFHPDANVRVRYGFTGLAVGDEDVDRAPAHPKWSRFGEDADPVGPTGFRYAQKTGVCVQNRRGEDERCRKQHGCRFEARSGLHIKVPRIIIGWQKIHTPET